MASVEVFDNKVGFVGTACEKIIYTVSVWFWKKNTEVNTQCFEQCALLIFRRMVAGLLWVEKLR